MKTEEQVAGGMKTEKIRPWTIFAVLMTAALLLLAAGIFLFRGEGAKVSVEKDRQILAEISFSRERWFGLDRQGQLVELSAAGDWKDLAEEQNLTHLFTVSPEGVQMRYAACPDQICIHQGLQSRSGSSVVCLPYRLVLQVTGPEEDDQADVIAQ